MGTKFSFLASALGIAWQATKPKHSPNGKVRVWVIRSFAHPKSNTQSDSATLKNAATESLQSLHSADIKSLLQNRVPCRTIHRPTNLLCTVRSYEYIRWNVQPFIHLSVRSSNINQMKSYQHPNAVDNMMSLYCNTRWHDIRMCMRKHSDAFKPVIPELLLAEIKTHCQPLSRKRIKQLRSHILNTSPK